MKAGGGPRSDAPYRSAQLVGRAILCTPRPASPGYLNAKVALPITWRLTLKLIVEFYG